MLPRRWVIRFALAAALCSIAGVCVASAVFSEFSLHVQRRQQKSDDPPSDLYTKASWQTVSIHATVDRVPLEAWFATSNGITTKGCVVVMHGISDSKAGSVGFAPMFLEAGFAVLIPDIRSHGRSGGPILTYGIHEKHDVLDWAHWLKAQQPGCQRIYALGESLGASILIQAAAVEPLAFAAIVAECPFADLRSIAEYRVNQLILQQANSIPHWSSRLAAKSIVGGGLLYTKARYGLDLTGASPLAAIERTRTPILLVHGNSDEKTAPDHSKRLAEASRLSSALWLVPKAGHTAASSTAPAEFRQRVFTWFAQQN
jgi:alpha-beta hydrolase superfamily lysophospholipase